MVDQVLFCEKNHLLIGLGLDRLLGLGLLRHLLFIYVIFILGFMACGLRIRLVRLMRGIMRHVSRQRWRRLACLLILLLRLLYSQIVILARLLAFLLFIF